MQIRLIILSWLISTAACAATNLVYHAPANIPAYKIAEAEEIYQNSRHQTLRPALNSPRRDPILGETSVAGSTFTDYWTNGVCGRMIIVDRLGEVHITYMDGYDSSQSRRQQKYNWLSQGEWLDADGVLVSPGTRSGFGSIALSPDDEQRGIVFCHSEGIINHITSIMCIDFGHGWGAFEVVRLPDYPDSNGSCIWPQGVISPRGRIHVAYNRRNAALLSYTSTRWSENLPNFPEIPVEISPMSINAYRIARSLNSERAAIVFSKSRVGIPAPPEWERFAAYQQNNDIWLAKTDDGRNWNFNRPTNITNCIAVDANREGDLAYGDTFRPFVNFDVIFDPDDFIHIVFEARGMWELPVYNPDEDRPPIRGMTVDASYLFHWSERDSIISAVADGWFTQQIRNENDSLLLWPQPGAWKSNVCAPTLGFDDNGDLYCVFNYYPREDYNNYVDPHPNFPNIIVGRCHGEIAVTVSEDNGRSWYYPTMITETHTPLAEPGEAMCEVYPTMNEDIDRDLHIFYLLDREAGSAIQDEVAQNTLNEVIYHRVPCDLVRRDSIWVGPNFHVDLPIQSAKHQADWTLAGFRIDNIRPNPFNSRAVIAFELRNKQNIELAVHSIDGRQTAVLFTGESAAGRHQVQWNADHLPAGLYFVRLSAENSSALKKVAIIK
ncbi:MAG: T9SS type A sorting domain-containing protein [Calditrichaeota bacterium]|nr:T9SS type A sorting domain-containing protein [Calditrichota bacterium]